MFKEFGEKITNNKFVNGCKEKFNKCKNKTSEIFTACKEKTLGAFDYCKCAIKKFFKKTIPGILEDIRSAIETCTDCVKKGKEVLWEIKELLAMILGSYLMLTDINKDRNDMKKKLKEGIKIPEGIKKVFNYIKNMFSNKGAPSKTTEKKPQEDKPTGNKTNQGTTGRRKHRRKRRR